MSWRNILGVPDSKINPLDQYLQNPQKPHGWGIGEGQNDNFEDIENIEHRDRKKLDIQGLGNFEHFENIDLRSSKKFASRESGVQAYLSDDDESAIRAWLDYIKENDPEIISETIERCRTDPGVREFFIGRARDRADTDPFPDDRRYCRDCLNLSSGGRCLAGLRGEIQAARNYRPLDICPRRCGGYRPNHTDPDQRPGFERWLNLETRIRPKPEIETL